jgi:hypothetical protein
MTADWIALDIPQVVATRNMQFLGLFTTIVASLLLPSIAAGGNDVANIQSDGEWTDLHLMDADRITIEMAPIRDQRSVVLSITQLQDRKSEKIFFIDVNRPVKGASIQDVGGGPQIGYAKGNFELIILIYLVKFDDGVDLIEIPKESFKNVPDYFKYVLPFSLRPIP